MLPGNRRPTRTAVFISGGGSTLQSLIESDPCHGIRLVVSNRRNAPGLLKARRFGLQTLVFGKDQTFYDISKKLSGLGIERIFLAGFMKIIPAEFISQWRGKIFNIHPSLLPAYPGLHGFERSFEAKSLLGATIHTVTEGVDEGPIFLQQRLASTTISDLTLETATWMLRRTEQHLLREFNLRKVM